MAPAVTIAVGMLFRRFAEMDVSGQAERAAGAVNEAVISRSWVAGSRLEGAELRAVQVCCSLFARVHLIPTYPCPLLSFGGHVQHAQHSMHVLPGGGAVQVFHEAPPQRCDPCGNNRKACLPANTLYVQHCDCVQYVEALRTHLSRCVAACRIRSDQLDPCSTGQLL